MFEGRRCVLGWAFFFNAHPIGSMVAGLVYLPTPLKFNMLNAKNGGLEDDFPFQLGDS